MLDVDPRDQQTQSHSQSQDHQQTRSRQASAPVLFSSDPTRVSTSQRRRQSSHQTDATSKSEEAIDARAVTLRRSDFFKAKPRLLYDRNDGYMVSPDGALPTMKVRPDPGLHIDDIADTLDTHKLREVMDRDVRRKKRGKARSKQIQESKVQTSGSGGWNELRKGQQRQALAEDTVRREGTRGLAPPLAQTDSGNIRVVLQSTQILHAASPQGRKVPRDAGLDDDFDGDLDNRMMDWRDVLATTAPSRAQPIWLEGNRESYPDFATEDKRQSESSNVLNSAWSTLWRRASVARAQKEADMGHFQTRIMELSQEMPDGTSHLEPSGHATSPKRTTRSPQVSSPQRFRVAEDIASLQSSESDDLLSTSDEDLNPHPPGHHIGYSRNFSHRINPIERPADLLPSPHSNKLRVQQPANLHARGVSTVSNMSVPEVIHTSPIMSRSSPPEVHAEHNENKVSDMSTASENLPPLPAQTPSTQAPHTPTPRNRAYDVNNTLRTELTPTAAGPGLPDLSPTLPASPFNHLLGLGFDRQSEHRSLTGLVRGLEERKTDLNPHNPLLASPITDKGVRDIGQSLKSGEPNTPPSSIGRSRPSEGSANKSVHSLQSIDSEGSWLGKRRSSFDQVVRKSFSRNREERPRSIVSGLQSPLAAGSGDDEAHMKPVHGDGFGGEHGDELEYAQGIWRTGIGKTVQITTNPHRDRELAPSIVSKSQVVRQSSISSHRPSIVDETSIP